jgi:hypothetical protein
MAFPLVFVVLGLFGDGIALDAPPPARQYLYISIDQDGLLRRIEQVGRNGKSPHRR